jgi:exopolysaccharide production protein ExoQ
MARDVQTYPARINSKFFNFNRDLLFSIIVFYYTARYFFLGLDLEQEATTTAGNISWQLFIFFALGNSALLISYFGVPLRSLLRILLPFAPMACWIILSIGWSEFPSLSFRRGSRLLLEVSLVAMLVSSFQSREQLLQTLFRVFFLINLIDLLSLAFPTVSQGVDGFQGVHSQKNVAGQFLYLALPVFAIGIMDRTISASRFVAIFAFATGVLMLALTNSKTAVGVSFISMFFVTAARGCMTRDVTFRAILMVILLLLACLATIVVFEIGPLDTFNMVFSDPSLTGRDRIWEFAFRKFENNPMLGVGYGALWSVGAQIVAWLQQNQVYVIVNQGHNGYIDILAQLGWIGFVILIIFIITIFYRVHKYVLVVGRNRIFCFENYALYVCWGSLFYNMTESSYFRSSVGMWFMLVVISSWILGDTEKTHRFSRT